MNTPRLVTAALLSLALTGCYSRLTGNDGHITFAYPAPSDVLDFNKPIAPGAKLDVFAQTVGGGEELSILTAESTDTDVLQVVEVLGSHVVVQGGTVGTAQLIVTTRDDREDRVDLHVARPDSIQLAHTCTDEAFAAYPANSDVIIPFGMRRGEQSVVGYGFWPVRVTPVKALELDRDSRDQGALHFKSTQARHRVAIRSTMDDAILPLALVENREVDGMSVDSFGLPALVEDDVAVVSFTPTIERVAFCQSSLLTRGRSLTPDVCDVSGRLSDDSEDDSNRASLVRVKALSYGICEFEVSYPEANEGDGLTRRFKLPVGKFPEMNAAEASPADTDGGVTPPIWLAPLLALLAPLSFFPLMRWKR